MFNIVSQMIILFALLALGYLCKKIKITDVATDRKLSQLVLSISLPAMILASVLDTDTLPEASQVLAAFGLGCASYAIAIAVSLIVTALLRIPLGQRGVFRFMMVFGNVGFMGFPVVNALFGQGALIYAAIFNLPFNLLVFTFGAYLIASDNKDSGGAVISWKQFVNPANIASLLAIILALLGVCNMPILGPGCTMLGNMTTPAALIIVGSNMGNLPTRDLAGTPKLWIMAAVKLIVCPTVVFLVMGLFTDNLVLLGTMTVIAAMPVANNGTMLSFQYGADSRTIARGTFITTLSSVFTIPVLAMLFGL